jgi:hypothetical protein
MNTIELMNWSFSQNPLDANEKLVLIDLARRCGSGLEITVTRENTQEMCCGRVSDRQFVNLVNRLQADNYITWTGRGDWFVLNYNRGEPGYRGAVTQFTPWEGFTS